MKRIPVTLETLTDVKNFIEICTKLPSQVQLVDNVTNQRINASSLLGVISTVEWSETCVECEDDIYDAIKQFIPVTSLTND